MKYFEDDRRQMSKEIMNLTHEELRARIVEMEKNMPKNKDNTNEKWELAKKKLGMKEPIQ